MVHLYLLEQLQSVWGNRKIHNSLFKTRFGLATKRLPTLYLHTGCIVSCFFFFCLKDHKDIHNVVSFLQMLTNKYSVSIFHPAFRRGQLRCKSRPSNFGKRPFGQQWLVGRSRVGCHPSQLKPIKSFFFFSNHQYISDLLTTNTHAFMGASQDQLFVVFCLFFIFLNCSFSRGLRQSPDHGWWSTLFFDVKGIKHVGNTVYLSRM